MNRKLYVTLTKRYIIVGYKPIIEGGFVNPISDRRVYLRKLWDLSSVVEHYTFGYNGNVDVILNIEDYE